MTNTARVNEIRVIRNLFERARLEGYRVWVDRPASWVEITGSNYSTLHALFGAADWQGDMIYFYLGGVKAGWVHVMPADIGWLPSVVAEYAGALSGVVEPVEDYARNLQTMYKAVK
jgi:hypothetical protein